MIFRTDLIETIKLYVRKTLMILIETTFLYICLNLVRNYVLLAKLNIMFPSFFELFAIVFFIDYFSLFILKTFSFLSRK